MTLPTIVLGVWGIPNSGKSSLVKELSKKNISIVSNKPQTTQYVVDTIYEENGIQIEILDTPGVNFKYQGIRGICNKKAIIALEDVTYKFIVIDVKKPVVPLINIDFSETFFVITKVDCVPLNHAMLIAEDLFKKYNPKELFYTSTKKPDSFSNLREFILSLKTETGHKHQAKIATNLSEKEICNEKTKEQLFVLLEKEVPYCCWVETETIEHHEKFIIVKQKIFVPRISYRKMILGSLKIKNIRELAEKNLYGVFGKRIKLSIEVIIKDINIEEKLNAIF